MDYRAVYRTGAEDYHRLVDAEDGDDNLSPLLTELLGGIRNAVELGAGTGRVTRLLTAAGIDVTATEPAGAMAALGRQLGPDRWCRADAAQLPFAAATFDAAVAGWVFGHQIEWSPDDWRSVIAGFLAECDRVTDHGPVVIIETLGTGHERPEPPPELRPYYAWLENAQGFTHRWIRTDYRFPTVETAAEVTGRFFGPEFAETVRRHGWARVPECTGIWWRSQRAQHRG